MRRPGAVSVLLLAIALAGCGGGAAEETAPPPTPLPDLPSVPLTLDLPTDSPDAALGSTPDPEAAWEELLASLPDTLVSRCRRASPQGAEMARAECTPASGADRATYALFQDDGSMLDAFKAILGQVPAADRQGPGCARGPGAQQLPTGRRTCYREGGAAAVAWTNDLVAVLATASRADGDWALLDAFWNDAGPVTP